jgi:hypothetical protein
MTPSERIDQQIEELTDWRGPVLARLRAIVHEAYPDIGEDWKWETAVFTHKGNVVAAGVFKEHVKLNFFKGALLDDPHGLFNAGLEAKKTRGIDFHEGDEVDTAALKELIQAGVALNKKLLVIGDWPVPANHQSLITNHQSPLPKPHLKIVAPMTGCIYD